jgi:hypothetical protein
LPVQRVIRPDHSFRGFAGQIASGTIHVGDTIVAQPSGHAAKVARIVTYDGDLEQAVAPQSITIVLDRELDISRGDLIADFDAPATITDRVEAALVWMDQQRLEPNRRYLIKHASQTAPVFVRAINYRANIATLGREPAQTLELNDIGGVDLQFLRPIALDLYKENRATGAFILIDPATNGTVAAGMITSASAQPAALLQASPLGPVAAAERAARWGHRGALLDVSAPAELIDTIERSLLSVGIVAVRINPDINEYLLHPSLLEVVTGTLIKSGVLAMVARAAGVDKVEKCVARIEGQERNLDPNEPTQAISAIHRLLADTQVSISQERAGI